MAAYATSLPVLVDMGFKIGRQWAQSRVAIPEPDEDEDILTRAEKSPPPKTEVPGPAGVKAAATAQSPTSSATEQLDTDLQPITGEWLSQIRALVDGAESLEQIRDGLVELLPNMNLDQYAEAMAQALAAAALRGRYDIIQEATNGR